MVFDSVKCFGQKGDNSSQIKSNFPHNIFRILSTYTKQIGVHYQINFSVLKLFSPNPGDTPILSCHFVQVQTTACDHQNHASQHSMVHLHHHIPV
jgi:hypothetical protein